MDLQLLGFSQSGENRGLNISVNSLISLYQPYQLLLSTHGGTHEEQLQPNSALEQIKFNRTLSYHVHCHITYIVISNISTHCTVLQP